MFHIVSGPFQPVLEVALVNEIRELKSADPSSPLAIVAPSEMLRRRLQWLLCVEHSLSLYDVHFLTFHQLALRLHAERTQSHVEAASHSFELVSDLTFRELLREILGREASEIKALSRFRQSPGLCAALWSTIRDLNEAMVDPSTVLQGLEEGLLEQNEEDQLRTLCLVQTMMQEEAVRRQVGSPDDLAKSVLPWVPDSPLLARLHRVCYYGFYDLSQVQLSLLEAVILTSQVTVYFPLVDDSAFAFAQQFYDRHLSSGIVDERYESVAPLEQERSRQRPTPSFVKIINAVGPDDEVNVVCKEIGNLIELHGYQFEEIGVVARTLEPYQACLSRMFEQHRIPCVLSIGSRLIHEPFMKWLLQLSTLVLRRYPSDDVFDIITSPYCRVDDLTNQQELIQPELWLELIQGLGIVRGQEAWNRLSSVGNAEIRELYDKLTTRKRPREQELTLESLQLFNRLVQELIADCQALPTRGCMEDLTEAFMQLMHKHSVLPGSELETQVSWLCSFGVGRSAEVVSYLREQFRQLECLQEEKTWQEWVELFLQVAEEGTLPIDAVSCTGVRVLDAMMARGLPFRAVFVLGLNEKVFPRYIREDAFLRDAHRRVLAETFGYKIDEKLSGYDEERLLFSLLEQAAQDRLYLSYQRADDAGRQLAPSPYIRALNRPGPCGNLVQEYSLRRRFSDRLDDSLFRDSLLAEHELSVKLTLGGIDPSILLQHFGRQEPLFRQGWKALIDIESLSRELGSYDGMLRAVDNYWQKLTNRGISPTTLEGYARCPFQFFASNLLDINTDRNQMRDSLAPSVVGTLCHSVLRQVYGQLIQEEWPIRSLMTNSSRDLISRVVEEVFSAYAHEYSTGYDVIWQLYKEMVKAIVSNEVEASQKECLQTGFRPIAVEVDVEGRMTLLDAWAKECRIHGRLDRVDRHERTEEIRIIDYKFKMGSKVKSDERNLLASSVRGLSLQPPMYSLMSTLHHHSSDADGHQPFQPQRVEFVYLAPHRMPMITRSSFEYSVWNSPVGQQLKNTMELLLTGMRDGQYFILPGKYCEHCSLSASCRRYHSATMSRSYQSTQAKRLRILRKQEIIRD